MARQKLSAKREGRKQEESKIAVSFAKDKFFIMQKEKQNSKQTLSYYERFFKKFYSFLDSIGLDDSVSVSVLVRETTQLDFIEFIEEAGATQQTINSYLRGYRSFGNYCEELGYIHGFKCPIKEIEPPAKEVYTDKELKRLLVKPDIKEFAPFRNYTIISLILTTGVRTNTILNVRIKDVNLDEGYITYNTTKAHKVAIIGLDRKCKSILEEYVLYWRNVETSNGDIKDTDFLFCNEFGEALTRSGLSAAIKRYNKKRGVSKSSIHLFRHTFAKNWITSGGDIITLAKVLTHSELAMVKRYSNLYGYDVKAEIEEHSTLSKLKTNSGNTMTVKKRKVEAAEA